VNEHQELIGFFSFEQEDDTIVLGFGLHPEYTGKGLGTAFVRAGLGFGAKCFTPSTFRLSVATFNQRAIRVYEHLGFVAEKVFLQQTNGGTYEFLQMRRCATCTSSSSENDDPHDEYSAA
jgi:ribosomal-protein-alanine N-acetyltransferase